MPLYYFDVFDGERLWPDDFGVELADLYEAREQAKTLLPDLARDTAFDGDRRDISVVVRCSAGRRRYQATLSFRAQRIDPLTRPGPAVEKGRDRAG